MARQQAACSSACRNDSQALEQAYHPKSTQSFRFPNMEPTWAHTDVAARCLLDDTFRQTNQRGQLGNWEFLGQEPHFLEVSDVAVDSGLGVSQSASDLSRRLSGNFSDTAEAAFRPTLSAAYDL